MARILRYSLLLVVICMTVNISLGTSSDNRYNGWINVGVYASNRTSPISSPRSQEVNRRTETAVDYHRAADTRATGYARPYQPEAHYRRHGHTQHSTGGTAPVRTHHSYRGEAAATGNARRDQPGDSYHRHIFFNRDGVRTVQPVDSRRVVGVTPAPDNVRLPSHDVSHNRPYQPDRVIHYSNRHQRRRYPTQSRNRDHPSYSGPRYGERGMNHWRSHTENAKTDSRVTSRPQAVHQHKRAENEKTDRRLPSPRFPTVPQHPGAPATNQDKDEGEKWIHCHQDGHAFVSVAVPPEVSII